MEAKTHVIIPEKEAKNHVIKEEDEHFHVLAVDDSVIERKMLEKLLTISSFHVTCVESGDKALEYLGLMNCHTPSVLAGSDVDPHHHHHDGADNIHDDDDDDNSDDEHDDDGGGGDGDSMIFPSIPLANAHKQQEGQGTRVNLIMTDYSMPGMSGYDLLKRVKESSWKDVPVVVMSSENVPSRIHMCLEEGAEEFLLKPVRLSDLKKLQPHILKFTSTATAKKTNPNFASNDDDHNKISNEAITAIAEEKRNNEDFITNSNEVKLKDEFQFRVDTENFAKILKLEQL